MRYKKSTIFAQPESEARVKSIDEEREDLVDSLTAEFADKRPDINSFIIRQDGEERFGLEIARRC